MKSCLIEHNDFAPSNCLKVYKVQKFNLELQHCACVSCELRFAFCFRQVYFLFADLRGHLTGGEIRCKSFF